MDCIVDSCIYAERKELEKFSLELLGGTVYTLPVETNSTERIAQSLIGVIREKQYSAVVVADGNQAGEIAVKIAGMLNTKCATAVTELIRNKESVQCTKMIYNNLLSASLCLPLNFVVSERMIPGNSESGCVELTEHVELKCCEKPDYILENEVIEESDLRTDSPVLIVVGMGVNSREDIERIKQFAKDQGFSFGVSRPVAMRGWADISEIIGVSGEIYIPEVTIAVGVSGAAAFMAGIEQSKYILSINVNPDAAIMKQSDAILVDDYQNALWPLLDYLKEWNQGRKERGVAP